jgi:hypothetical protein
MSLISEEAFADWLMNYLQALHLAKQKKSGIWGLYYNWNYGSMAIEQWYEVYCREPIIN